MGDVDWIEPADWRCHSPEFVDVRVHDDGRPIVVVELVPPDRASVGAGWDRLRELWLDLPPHPNVIDAVDLCGDDGVLLRYAAIDWRRKPAVLRERAFRTENVVAGWGIQLSSAMETILSAVTEQEAAWFSRPMVKIDLDAHARMAFLPAVPHELATRRYLGPEVSWRWPCLDECGLVHVVGRVLADLTERDGETRTSMTYIIEKCFDPTPTRRYRTFVDLRRDLRTIGPLRTAVRHGAPLDTWRLVEAGIGWLAAGDAEAAIAALDEANATPDADELGRFIDSGMAAALRRLGRKVVIADDAPPASEVSPNAGARAHYLRGKELHAMGRLDDARTCLEKALALDPCLIEAMHLRREVDRRARRALDDAGHQYPPTFDPPEDE